MVGRGVGADAGSELAEGLRPLVEDPRDHFEDVGVVRAEPLGSVARSDFQVGDLLLAQAHPRGLLDAHRPGFEHPAPDQVEDGGGEGRLVGPALGEQRPDDGGRVLAGRLLLVLAVVVHPWLAPEPQVPEQRQRRQERDHHGQRRQGGAQRAAIPVCLLGECLLLGEDRFPARSGLHGRPVGRRQQPARKHRPQLYPLAGRDSSRLELR